MLFESYRIAMFDKGSIFFLFHTSLYIVPKSFVCGRNQCQRIQPLSLYRAHLILNVVVTRAPFKILRLRFCVSDGSITNISDDTNKTAF